MFDENSATRAVKTAAKTAGGAIKSEVMFEQQLPEESHQPIIRKRDKYKVYSSFKNNTYGADIADIQLISKYNN